MRAVASQPSNLANKPRRRQRPRRHIRAADEAQMSLSIPIANWQAKLGWRLACWGLTPVAGFPLGLAALVFGLLGWRRVYRKPEDLGIRHAAGGVIVGALETLFNFAGIISVFFGLRQLGIL